MLGGHSHTLKAGSGNPIFERTGGRLRYEILNSVCCGRVIDFRFGGLRSAAPSTTAAPDADADGSTTPRIRGACAASLRLWPGLSLGARAPQSPGTMGARPLHAEPLVNARA